MSLTLSRRKWSVYLRLSGRRAFSVFFNNSGFSRLKACLVFSAPNDLGYARLGITIKCRCTSIQRSSLKRTIREAFRKNAKGSFDYNVLIQGHRVISREYLLELRRNLEQEWSRRLSTESNG